MNNTGIWSGELCTDPEILCWIPWWCWSPRTGATQAALIVPSRSRKLSWAVVRVQQHYGPGKGRIVCHMPLLNSTRLTLRSLDHRKGNHLSPWSQLLMRDLYILRPTQFQLSREETSFLLGQRKCFIKLGSLLCLKLLLVLMCSGALSRWLVSVWELSNNRRPWDATSLAFSVYEGNTAQC